MLLGPFIQLDIMLYERSYKHYYKHDSGTNNNYMYEWTYSSETSFDLPGTQLQSQVEGSLNIPFETELIVCPNDTEAINAKIDSVVILFMF